MGNKRQLVVVVEGTSAVGPSWRTIYREYLLNIIRRFYWNGGACGEVTSTDSFFPEMALIAYKTRDSGAMIRNSGWTKDLNTYVGWLTCITFSDMYSTSREVATAEGLGEAIKMLYDSSQSANSDFTEVHRHCILVCASDPDPAFSSGEQNSGTDYLNNVESLANCFSHLPVTLSVVSPNRLPKWMALYNIAGLKSSPDHESTKTNLEMLGVNSNYPSYTVLLAERFREAHSMFDFLGPVEDLICIPGIGIADTSRMQGIPLTRLPISPPTAIFPSSSSDVDVSVSGNILNASKVPGDTLSNRVGSLFGMASQHRHAFNSLSGYVKIWEGTLCRPVRAWGGVLSRLEAFASSSSSAPIVGNWPSRMEIIHTPPKMYLNDRKYDGTEQYIMFRTLDHHWFLYRLQKKNLCAVIELPTHTVILSTCKEPGYLAGVLLRRRQCEECQFEKAVSVRARSSSLVSWHTSCGDKSREHTCGSVTMGRCSRSNSCSVQPLVRCIGPRYDPEGEYVRNWFPELARMSTEWIHHPWEDRICRKAASCYSLSPPFINIDG